MIADFFSREGRVVWEKSHQSAAQLQLMAPIDND
jgi:hypothetical protein